PRGTGRAGGGVKWTRRVDQRILKDKISRENSQRPHCDMDWHRHFLRGISRSHIAFDVTLRGESKSDGSHIGSRNNRVSRAEVAAAGKQDCRSIKVAGHVARGHYDGI